jgi:hypothetical protein
MVSRLHGKGDGIDTLAVPIKPMALGTVGVIELG